MATEMSLRVGKHIRQRREELGIRTQRELADKIPSPSVTNQTINKWEQGVNEPGSKYKQMLADALDVDVAYFIAEDPKPTTPDLSLPRDESDRIAGLEDQLERVLGLLHETRSEQDRISALLERQTRVLERIEQATQHAHDAADRLDASVEQAGQALRAGTPRPRPRAAKPARKSTPKASGQDPA